MELRFDYIDELVMLLQEPPATSGDRRFVLPRLAQFEDLGSQIVNVKDVPETQRLLELVIESDNTYGLLLRERSWGFQAVAYWRRPPLPGFDRIDSINAALRRDT